MLCWRVFWRTVDYAWQNKFNSFTIEPNLPQPKFSSSLSFVLIALNISTFNLNLKIQSAQLRFNWIEFLWKQKLASPSLSLSHTLFPSFSYTHTIYLTGNSFPIKVGRFLEWSMALDDKTSQRRKMKSLKYLKQKFAIFFVFSEVVTIQNWICSKRFQLVILTSTSDVLV